MLIVLDNARDTAQVRPLLPGAPGCLAAVTSRNQLTGLIATNDAHPVPLEVLTLAESRELLTRRLGAPRVAAEPDAVGEIIAACARLPLALAILAARATTRPRTPLATFATELADARGRLDLLAGDDPYTDVRTVFSWSYRSLTPDAARLFRLLAAHPGPDSSATAAASLAGLPPARAHAALAELTGANLLSQPAAGRYSLHDLLRAYARDLATRFDTDEERRAASHRVLDHYLHSAHTAAVLISPGRTPIALS